MRPLEGRRLWLVGIGGAGFAGYALLAHAWGAEVRGWDRVRTPYLPALEERGLELSIEPEPQPSPAGFETFVSTAYAGSVEGRSRAELLAELVSLARSVVVSGAHGKTTTSAMIAFCLDRLGGDPSFLIGGEVPQLGGFARAGSGWLVVEGDESDRTVAELRPEIAVVTNIDLDHHASFASRAEVEELFEEWLRNAPHAVRGWELAPLGVELKVPGEHNRRNAAAALAALELIGLEREAAIAALGQFGGVRRRLEYRGVAGGVEVYDDYGHNPAKVAAAIAAIAAIAATCGDGRVLVLFQPHLYSRTRYLARELAEALAPADAVAVTDVYGAREAPLPGVTGKLVVDALTEACPGTAVAWTPEPEDGVRFLAARARSGDRVLVVGAGDVDNAVPLLLEELG